MFSPLQGYTEREKFGMFAVHTALASGLAVEPDSGSTASMTPSPYGPIFGNVVVANCVTASGTLRELGWLEQPVTTSGPSLLQILGQIYNESVPIDANAVIVQSKAGAMIATDQLDATILFDGSLTPGTPCGIHDGKPRTVQTGDAPRLRLLGQVTQRGVACGAFLVM